MTNRNPFEGVKAFFRSRSLLSRLIIINVAVWIFIRFLDVFFDLFNASGLTQEVIGFLAVPAATERLIFRPWTLLTYMFLHFDFFHILFNMLWLYWFGRIFNEFLSGRQLLSVYILGGLAGAAFYVLSFNIFPKFDEIYKSSVALGASASVMAIVVAVSVYAPNYRIYLLFFGPVRIMYIALLSILLDVLMIKSQNSGGHLAHLGGAVWGFAYISMLRKGNDISAFTGRLSFRWLTRIFSREKYSRFRTVYSGERPKTDEEYNAQRAERQKRIDHILDKISKSGYESLTREEKDFLFRESSKNNP
ncbi:MAG: rhomboid family intramembrane serine protease [Bacteroidales bacterium]|nr:rhomboid family intramembrane serine protease [Bacteroidales bacterium]